MDGVVFKGLIWGAMPVVIIGKETVDDRKTDSFPWLPCICLMCTATVFLYTVRLLNGLLHTYALLSLVPIVLAIAAGIIEEYSFRWCLFRKLTKVRGFAPAAVISSALFTLYHYPGIILGDFTGLLSLRTVLIFGMGVLFCWMIEKWRSPALNVVVHCYWDILSYLFCLAG